MSKFFSLLRFYSQHPALLVKHLGRFLLMLVGGDLKKISKQVRMSASDVHNARTRSIEKDAYRKEVQRRLDRRKEVASVSPANVISQVRNFVGNLHALEVVGDFRQQLRIVQAHLLMEYAAFEPEFYRRRYMNDVQSISPLDHYITFGMDAGLWPNPVFDPTEYLTRYPDVAESGLDPVLHYSLFGWKENRHSGSHFDGIFYLERYTDVKDAGMPPLTHYIAYGRKEARRPTRDSAFGEDWDGGSTRLQRNRGTLLIVTHDTEVGGAQQLMKILCRWLSVSTQFDLRIVAMKGGPQVGAFQDIAPLFNYDGHVQSFGETEARRQLREWAGPDVKAAFVNSVASGGFFDVWGEPIPAVSYIHELPQIIERYGENINKIREHSKHVLAGSHAVKNALIGQFGLENDKVDVVYSYVENFDRSIIINPDERSEFKSEIAANPEALVVLGCGIAHWRKAPHTFIDVAVETLATTSRALEFVWVGGGEDLEECRERVERLKLGHVIRFVGQQDDISPWFRACDVFLLPSEEDPFPLVGLYAAVAAAPIICFEDAGGMPEFVSKGCGVAVSFKDTSAMAAALLGYVNDDELRIRVGLIGQEIALGEHTIAMMGPKILHYIRQTANIPPKLSVIVPNYNYEAYLEERLESIQSQTYQDFEVILLDDNSSDRSVDLLEKYQSRRAGTKLIVNEVNSGSPFRQWIKGMRAASADLVWLAEADDFADDELIVALLSFMEDRNVFLSYVKSVPVNSEGQVQGDYEPMYLDRINKGRWSRSYRANDHVEMNSGLGIANCIPNASSVILRKFEPDPAFEDAVSEMRLCGDWYFYIRAILGGEIAYCQRSLNFHRRHTNTVTHKLEGSRKYFDELATVREYVASHYDLSVSTLDQIEDFVLQDLDRFGISDAKERTDILNASVLRKSRKTLPSLAVVTPDISPGGGQVFAITLANGWAARGGRAYLFNVGQLPDHPEVRKRIDSRVSYYDCRTMGVSFADMIALLDVDVIHSSIWWSDRMVHSSKPSIDPSVAWVVSMHGCAETILENPDIDPSFSERIPDMLKEVDAWAFTAEKNQKVFDVFGQPECLLRVDNGIALKPATGLSRSQLGLREKSLLLCVATRAVEEKGWYQAVEITRRLNDLGTETDLMLIGEGSVADAIRAKKPAHVHLFGQVSNLQDYIELCDIGLLPSYFIGESLPLVILEFMGHGKPVIATSLGEIPAILGENEPDPVGIVLPLKNEKPDIDGFVSAIRKLSDSHERIRLGQRAKARFEERYTLDRMLDSFSSLYEKVLEERRSGLKDHPQKALGRSDG